MQRTTGGQESQQTAESAEALPQSNEGEGALRPPEQAGRFASHECSLEAVACEDNRARYERALSLLEEQHLAFGAAGKEAEKAKELLSEVLRQEPNWPQAKLQLARAHLGLGEAEAALALLTPLASRFSREAEVLGARGVALLATGRVDASVGPLERATRLDEGSAERWRVLATAQFLAGRLDQAERSYRAALARNASLAQAHGDLGTLLVLSGRVDEGLGHLRRAAGLMPRRASFQSNLAYAHFVKGDLERAEELARRAIELDDELASGWLNLGLVQAKQGRLDDAKASFERARELDPEDPRVKNNLADLEALEAEQ